METAFDKANSFIEKVKGVFEEYGVDVNVEEEQHHAATYTFIVSKDGVSVNVSVDDIIY